MAKADLGLKRTCLSCGMRFYDFKRTPIVCPGCQTEFDPEAVIRSRRGRTAAKDSAKASKQTDNPVMDDSAEMDEIEDKDEASTEEDAVEAGEGGEFNDTDIEVDDDDSAGLIDDDLDEDTEIIPAISNDDE
jgi:uncharacterized protein (TIGR02300 family)